MINQRYIRTAETSLFAGLHQLRLAGEIGEEQIQHVFAILSPDDHGSDLLERYTERAHCEMTRLGNLHNPHTPTL